MNEVLNYYNGYDEENRLNKNNVHKLEYLTSIHYLDKVIKPGSRILDVGAGTGKYAFYLANKGFSVTAGDIVPRFVELMRERLNCSTLRMDIYWGDACDLSRFDSCSYDAVLCMGPLYHLKEEKDRSKVIEQCLRVLKQDGIIISAYINRFASYMLEFMGSENLLGDRAILEDTLHKGYNTREKLLSFYFSYPQEIEALMSAQNVEKIFNIGTDGIAYLVGSKINNLTEQEYSYWVDYHLKTCENESLIGHSLHGLYIGKKK